MDVPMSAVDQVECNHRHKLSLLHELPHEFGLLLECSYNAALNDRFLAY